MTDVMRVRAEEKRKPLGRGMWVRIRRKDEYKDDLAQVVAINDTDGLRAQVRLIPESCRLLIFSRNFQNSDQERIQDLRRALSEGVLVLSGEHQALLFQLKIAAGLV